MYNTGCYHVGCAPASAIALISMTELIVRGNTPDQGYSRGARWHVDCWHAPQTIVGLTNGTGNSTLTEIVGINYTGSRIVVQDKAERGGAKRY